MCRKVMIGGAWPYANGSLHIGHLAGLLPGDVLARYHRAIGDEVYYVSGSDCHGTPVSIRAAEEGRSPREVSDAYHQEFCSCFEKLGFSYDVYGKTSQPEHVRFVQEFHEKLYRSPYVYEKETLQAYCEKCGRFLPDRFVEGKCPNCGGTARGDQCDVCGAMLEAESLIDTHCTVCGTAPSFRKTRHLYIALSKLQGRLQELVDTHPAWRRNAIAFTNRYLKEGLRDRALTRDLDWGIEVPKEGYEGKKIYIWAENVLGYLSMSRLAAEKRGESFESLWAEGENVLHYYVHAKDNIPFHTIILPALLLAAGGLESGPAGGPENGPEGSLAGGPEISPEGNLAGGRENGPEGSLADGSENDPESSPSDGLANSSADGPADGCGTRPYHLPDRIVSSEYLTLEGRKISTSQNWAIWAKDIVEEFQPDALRYFLLANGPEKRDTDFSRAEFIKSVNGELLGTYGNFVNRSLKFLYKYYGGEIPVGQVDPSIQGQINILYGKVARLIEEGRFREALEAVFGQLRQANKFFDEKAPWTARTENPASCRNTLYNCVQIIANAAVLLAPFLPFSSEKIAGWLGIDLRWGYKAVPDGVTVPEPEILFTRLEA